MMDDSGIVGQWDGGPVGQLAAARWLRGTVFPKEAIGGR